MNSTITSYLADERKRHNQVQFAERQPLTENMRVLLEHIAEMDLKQLEGMHVDLGIDAMVHFPAQGKGFPRESREFAVAVIAFRVDLKEFLVYLTRAHAGDAYAGTLCSGSDINHLIESTLSRTGTRRAWDTEKRTFAVDGFRTLYADADGDCAGADIDGLRMSVTSQNGYLSEHQRPFSTAQLLDIMSIPQISAEECDDIVLRAAKLEADAEVQ